jgi:transcriptional regulator with XRE-family HTH domain
MNRETIIKNFALNLRLERVRQNIKQERLAELANISPEYLARIEAGKYNPTLIVVVSLANALNVSIDKLISKS